MKENILKHLRAPEGVDEEKWRREFYFYVETSTSWLYWSLEYEDLEESDIQQSVENLCDRCEALEAENARLRDELAKLEIERLQGILRRGAK